MKNNNKKPWFLKTVISILIIGCTFIYFNSSSSTSFGNYKSYKKSSPYASAIPNRLKWKDSFVYKKDKYSYLKERNK